MLATDVQGRVTNVAGVYVVSIPPAAPVEHAIYSAGYTYYTNRDLVDTITYGNGTQVQHFYDDLDRVTNIIHYNPIGPATILQMDYTYDARGLITQVHESGIDGEAFVLYTYDARGRLTEERRLLVSPYHLTYTYDAGGNRETKVDVLNSVQTTYHYDDDNNRLLWYAVVPTGGPQNGFTLERVEYEYEHDGDAAGNVRRVVRKVPVEPSAVPDEWNVFATEFFYNRAGEVQVISQRTWDQVDELEGPVISNLVTTSIREFRGNGRTRYMMRDRIINPGQPDDLMPDYDTGTWTSYDGDLPTQDLTLNWVTDPTGHYVGSDVTRYHLGLVQFTPGEGTGGGPPAPGDFDVRYFHPDHLGTTRAMTDEGQTGPPAVPPTANPRLVYTAFGEPVSVNGTIESRFRFSGENGYETFDFTPYLHVGHRWYDTSTGRFLQRDTVGIFGGMNVYTYVDNIPTYYTDPSGLQRVRDGGAWAKPSKGPPGRTTPSDRLPYYPPGYNVFDVPDTPITELPPQYALPNAARNCLMTIFPGPTPPSTYRPYCWDCSDNGRSGTGNCPGHWVPAPPEPQRRTHGGSSTSRPTILDCFVAGTHVWTVSGPVEIESIVPGDAVVTREGPESPLCLSFVSSVRSSSTGTLVELDLGQDVLRCTSGHPFWIIGRGWVTSAAIRTGDRVLAIDGDAIVVRGVTVVVLEKPVATYVISVTDTKMFFVGGSGVLVHNKPL